jgi:hypothetical protein
MMRMNLREKILDGYEIATCHPCSVCRGGKTFKDWPHFHGTDFGKCVRSVQYGKLAKHDEFEREKRPHLSDGHFHEAATASALRAAGVQVDHRQDAPEGVTTDEFIVGFDPKKRSIRTFKDFKMADRKRGNFELIVVGHLDGRINGKYLYEHKAVEKYSFERFQKGARNPAYEGQMKCYMTALDLEGGYLVVKWREKSQFCEDIWVDRDDDFVWDRVNEFMALPKYINERKWAPCIPQYKGEQRWCEACQALGREK